MGNGNEDQKIMTQAGSLKGEKSVEDADFVENENRKKHIGRNFTDKAKREAYIRQDGLCAYCGKPLSVSKYFNKHYEGIVGFAHHLVTIKIGGKNKTWNCIYLCKEHHLEVGHDGNYKNWVRLKVSDFPFGKRGFNKYQISEKILILKSKLNLNKNNHSRGMNLSVEK